MIGCTHRDKGEPRCWGSCVQAKDKLKLVHWSAVVHNVITTHIGHWTTNVQSDDSLLVDCGQLSHLIRFHPESKETAFNLEEEQEISFF